MEILPPLLAFQRQWPGSEISLSFDTTMSVLKIQAKYNEKKWHTTINVIKSLYRPRALAQFGDVLESISNQIKQEFFGNKNPE